jgi:ribonuclease E/ribonuclease G
VVLFDGAGSLFEHHDCDSAIAALGHPRVELSNGGSIVIERTEAMTVIDVNGGAAVGPLSINLAAAEEIARQLQLRHIGGLIVIDFVSMTKQSDRDRLNAAFRNIMLEDPAPTRILPISALGLVELSRERRGPELELHL